MLVHRETKGEGEKGRRKQEKGEEKEDEKEENLNNKKELRLDGIESIL